MGLKKISVVVPAYNEEKNFVPFYQEMVSVLGKDLYEWIVVDDGSTDQGKAVLEQLRMKDARVKWIRFSRNFGQQAALTAGLDFAEGDAVIVMDADLQHPPQIMKDLLNKWEAGADFVYTIRSRNDSQGFLKSIASRIYYWAFKKLSGVELPPGAADFRLYDRKVVLAMRQLEERTRFFRGLSHWVGFKSAFVTYQANPRKAGSSSYSWGKMFRLALDGVVSFSTKPLLFSVFLGGVISFLGALYGVYAIFSKLVWGYVVTGWTSLMVVIAVLGGIQIFLMGVIGIYIGKIFEEVKRRPLYIVSEEVGF